MRLGMDVNSREKSYQAKCFTPKRSLARTPPKKRHEAENISPNITQQQDDKNKVQKEDSLNGAIDEIPPPRRWEIPRTPVRVVEHVQLQLTTIPARDGGSRSTPIQRTPVRIKTPIHPLAHSNKATPTPMSPIPTERTPTVRKGGGDDQSKPIVRGTESDKSVQKVESGDHGETGVTKSPPISISKGMGTLPGFNCTENDLAFLQRMQTIKQYEELKAEAAQLEKAHKTASEQREQFQHKIVKIERDLRDMKLTYQEAASSVHSLITTTRDTSLLVDQSPPSTSTTSASKHQIKASQSEETVLTEAQLARLRKLNQLSSAKVEKSEKEVKGKLVEVERARWQLQAKIREEEERKLAEEAELQSRLEVTKQEQQKWKQKVDEEEELYTSLKNKLREAQSELATLQQENKEMDNATLSAGNEDKSMSEADEKRQTKERLKRLIRRCELYIQRHQMLREMGTK